MTLGGVFYGVKHGARQMLEQGRAGVIINISSVNGRQPGEGQSAYCAAKAGVDMITRCGALELGGRGIRVVGIAPGLVETPLTRHELENPAMRELFLGVIPMKRAVAAEEIAAAAVFLASDNARSINGETIAIDGGSLTRGYPALLTGLRKASDDRARTVYERPDRGRESLGVDREPGASSRRGRELRRPARAVEASVRARRPARPDRGPRPGRAGRHRGCGVVARRRERALHPCAARGAFPSVRGGGRAARSRARRRISRARGRCRTGGAAPGDRPVREALSLRERLAKEDPGIHTLGALASLLAEMDRWAAAETSYAAALEADSGVSPLPCGQLLFEWGVSAMRRGELDRAEALFGELDAILPAHVPGRGHRAEVALARGQLDVALALITPLLDTSDDPEYRATYAEILAARGETRGGGERSGTRGGGL